MAVEIWSYPWNSVISPFLLALLIPISYSLIRNRKELKTLLLIFICSLVIVVFYPITSYLATIMPMFGYSIGKLLLFVLLPTVTVFYIERWHIKEIFSNLGVRKKGIRESVLYGLAAALITIIVSMAVASYQPDVIGRIVLFFEAFTEEFFFRGFLLLYLTEKTTSKIAYTTSILGFILIHPQHFGSLFLISTIAQGVLLAIVADKTKNIIGPWISHGLNRLVPVLIKTFL